MARVNKIMLPDGTEYILPYEDKPTEMYLPGDIFITTREGNPADILGYGTWELIKDRVLIGAGGEYEVGQTGGSVHHAHTTRGHTLTIAQMPNHGHKVILSSPSNGTSEGWGLDISLTKRWDYGGDNGSDFLYSTGGNQAHDHGSTEEQEVLPPFYAVYIWLRIA